MSRFKTFTGVIGGTAAILGLTLAGAGGAAAATASPRLATATLPGSMAPFAASSRATGDLAAGTKLTVELWLKPRAAAAAKFAAAVSTPGTSRFHHYLSPAAYTARFGPSAATVRAVSKWLRGQGFTAVTADPHATATTAGSAS